MFKTFKLNFRFYTFFVLIILIPATLLSKYLKQILESNPNKVIQEFVSWGVIEVPTAIVIIFFLFWFYEKYLWKIAPFRYLHGNIPNINGRYEGEAESSYDNKKYKIVIEIKQTLLKSSVDLFSERSSSFSTIATIGKNEHDNWTISYIYNNKPKTVSKDLDMRAHNGFASLEIFTDENKLDGTYYNDSRERKTHGKISCKHIDRKIKGHF